MSTVTEDPTKIVTDTSPHGKGRMTEEQRQAILSIAGVYKDNPVFVERMMEGVREFRQRIQEETERELDEAERPK